MSAAIGIDLGGTNIKAALVDVESASVIASLSKPTRDGEFEDGVPLLLSPCGRLWQSLRRRQERICA